MKQLFILGFILFTFNYLTATDLQIRMKDGSTISVPLNDIDKMMFSELTSFIPSSHKQTHILNQLLLFQNHPNPFNPSTIISYEIPNGGKVLIYIYNTQGQLVQSFQREHVSAGMYRFEWSGLQKNGMVLSSGIYLYQVAFEGNLQTKRMLYIK